MAKNKTISRLLGEAEEMPSPAAVEQDAGTQGQPLQHGVSPSVETLMALWDKGEHAAVAVRVIDALDSYQQFVELLFQIGREGALELGGIMDEFTAPEKSPHEYDTVPDTEVAAQYGHGPKSGPSTHAAVGESTADKIIGQP